MGDRPFSLHDQFPDEWYNLHNPAQAAKPRIVSFRTQRDDFPPHLEGLEIAQLLLYCAGSDVTILIQLHFTPENSTTAISGEAGSTADGVNSN